ncbi:hypothetical protein Tco_0768378 [Tanacetum coccineum]
MGNKHSSSSKEQGVPNVSKADSFESEYKSWGDSDDDNDDHHHQSDDKRTEFDDDKSVDLNKTNDEEKDEFIHTPDDYVPTDDENVDDEEYDRINKEMYDNVNVELKDAEPANEKKGDGEMTRAEKVNVEHEEVSQEVVVQHEDPSIHTSPLLTVPVTVILETLIAPATTIPLPIPPLISIPQQSTPIPTPTTTEATTSTIVVPDSETLSAIHLRVSDLEKEVKELKNVDHSSALLATIKYEVPAVVKEYLGTSLNDALYKVLQRHTADLSKEHSIPADVVEKLKQQEKPQKMLNIYARTLFETMTKTKSFNKNTKHKALYHALMESILEDEDAMDKGVADKSKKRKTNDVDRDEGPPTGPDQGLKRKKTGKDTEPSKKAKSTGTSKVLQDLGKYMGNTDEPLVVKADPKDWLKNPERPPTPDREWNECKTVDSKPTQKWLSDLAKEENSSRTFNDLMSTLIDFSAFAMNRLIYVELEYNMEECYKALNDQLDWNNLEGDKYPFDLSKPLPLVLSRNHQIVPIDYFFNNDLAYLQGGSTSRTYTTSLTKMKAAKYDRQGIEDMVPNLSDKNLYKFMEGDFLRLHLNDIEDMLLLVVHNRLFNLEGNVIVHLAAALPSITNLEQYTTYSTPKGVIYLDKLDRNRLMCSYELYKFSDGTIISVRDKLKDMLKNVEVGYTSVIPRRRWRNLDKKRSRIMVKYIDHQLLEIRLMRSLEKFVGGREYGEDLRLLQRHYTCYKHLYLLFQSNLIIKNSLMNKVNK